MRTLDAATARRALLMVDAQVSLARKYTFAKLLAA